MKSCTKCKESKPVGDFQKNASKPDGLQNYCRNCMNAANRKSQERHAQKRRARNAKYDAEHAEERKAYRAEWRKRNAAKIKAQNAAYRKANAAKRADDQRTWQAANPDKVRAYVLERIARKKNAITYIITVKDLRRLMSSPCAFANCTQKDIELDHVIPLSRGGSHGIGNLQSLCRHHNRTKHAKLWVEYRASLALQAAA